MLVNADDALQPTRPLRYESLEDRRVLSATGFEAIVPSPDSGFVTADFGDAASQQSTVIERLVIEVNGQRQELTTPDSLLELVAGDTIEVIEIGFNSSANEGVFAAEGYLNKISDLSSASLVDYNDGRFSERGANPEATGGSSAVAGLSGQWTVESGWDRLSINLMHYTESSTDVASRWFLGLQVGQPDFEFDTNSLEQINDQPVHAGEDVTIPGRWINNLEGTYHNYAEVDVYNANNMNEIIWAGALVGNVATDNVVEGEFLNTREEDAFSEKWVPETEGEYVLRYYIDPEQRVTETNESNNFYEIRVNAATAVAPAAAPEAVNDSFDSNGQSLDVLANDLPGNADDTLQVSEFTQAEHGTVSHNEDGSLSYTPDEGFFGDDEFKYTVTDGEQVSNEATVSLHVDRTFAVMTEAQGQEDTPIDLNIDSDYDSVMVSGVPNGVELSKGEKIGIGDYLVSQDDVQQLTITPAENSDSNFQLTVTPVLDEVVQRDLSETINVQVESVVDGGFVDVESFGIVGGASGKVPMKYAFGDTDGSENHTITFSGLPEFMKMSEGDFDGSNWSLTVNDLDNLRIKSDKVEDLSDWQTYNKKFVYKEFEVTYTIDSTEAKTGEVVTTFHDVTIFSFQKSKK